MKKLFYLLICLTLPLAALAEAVPPLSEEDFRLTVGEDTFTLGGDAAALVAALEGMTGAPMDVTETVSCMFDGMDREFANDDVLVGTYPIGDGGSDWAESVLVFTDALATARGATVGMAREEIEALYGADYVLDWDTMIYTLGEMGPQLMFTLDLDAGVVVAWMLLLGTVA